ncbi:MAG: phosphonate ABC transporter, permease protein PhnE [Acidobacteria bacterium]|nr:phosphonate ABC transporter, permease protein PhnE [Acidobacteriota bacterium]
MTTWTVRAIVAVLVVLAMVFLANLGLLDGQRVGRGLSNLGEFMRGLWPPASAPMPSLAEAALETLQIAYVGTVLGAVVALPLSVLSTRTLFGPAVGVPVSLLLASVRTVPSLLWAVVFVAAFGLGPAAGALGIAAYTTGYLGKLFREAFDGVDAEVIEAVRSVGCTRLQLARYALLPEASNHLLSQLLFAFEYNVRASSILGFVGAGGIGFYMLGYLQLLQYRNLATALLVTLALVLLIDGLSGWARRTITGRT